MNKRKAFSAIDMLLSIVVIFALFMYFLPTIKSSMKKPLDKQPALEDQVNDKIEEVTNLRQEAEEQNRKMLEQINY